jgi:hypothetical protein
MHANRSPTPHTNGTTALTTDEARRLTSEVKRDVAALREKLLRLYEQRRPSRPLPAYLSDGQSVSTSFELDGLIDELWRRIGDEARLRSKVRAYV